MQKKKAVVTGGEGFIGSHVCRALEEQGYEAVPFDLKSGFDIRDRSALDKAFAGAAHVFHLAALPSVQYSLEHPEETEETNIRGTLNVLQAAKAAQVSRVVFSSSAAVYGDPEKLPLKEDMLARPKSPYALEKLAGERYCKLFSDIFGLGTVSLRYFNVYGSGMDPKGAYALMVGKFIERRVAGKPLTITGDGTQTRDFINVADVVRANILVAEHPAVGKGEVFNIGSGVQTSVQTVADLIGGEKEYVAPRIEPHNSCADIARAKEVLGWEPLISLEEGIAELKKPHSI